MDSEPDDECDRGGDERLLCGFWFCTLGEEDVSFLDFDFWAGGAVLSVFGVGLSGRGCTLGLRRSGDRDLRDD